MRAFLVLLAFMAAGCQLDKSPASSTPETKADELFARSTTAVDWLADSKHTLLGMAMDESQTFLSTILQAGAVEIRLGEIEADPSDPAFQRAKKVLVAMPTDKTVRKTLLETLNRLDKEAKLTDTGQRHEMINVVP